MKSGGEIGQSVPRAVGRLPKYPGAKDRKCHQADEAQHMQHHEERAGDVKAQNLSRGARAAILDARITRPRRQHGSPQVCRCALIRNLAPERQLPRVNGKSPQNHQGCLTGF